MAQDDFQAFIERIKQAESRGQRYDKQGNLLTSPKGAQGEMQVMPATQRAPGFGVAPVRDNSPDEIARVGRDVLHAFDAKYGGNRMYIAAAYNWGPGNVDKWIAGGADFNKLPRETQRYLQQVAPEAWAQSRGQRPSATATAAAPSEPAPADTRTIAIGDSLAVGFAQANKLGGLHKGGAAPKAVLKMVQDYAANNNLEGVTVYLGTGLPNNPAQREFVTRQVELIKSKGGIPVLIGAGPGSERTPTTGQNEFLQNLAQSTGSLFTGPLADRFPGIEKRDRTGLHLTHPQYRQLFSQMRGSAPPAAAAATTAVQPAGAAATAPTTAAAAAAPVAAATAARAEDLGSGYKAALALAFLGEEEKERESTDDELRDRLNRQEDEAAARELAEYRPVNPLQNLEITALNPIRALQPPVRMAEGGEAKKDEPKNASAMTAREALDKVVGLGMGPMGMGANLGYNIYKHFSGKTPLEDLLRDARQANQPIDPTRDMEPMGRSGGMRPIKRSNGSPEGGEVALTPEEIAAASRPATFNPNIARQGAAARALAAQRDVNLLPDPRTYAAVSGFLGQAPDQLGFSAMHPDIQGITRAGEVGFAASLVPVVAPVVAPVGRAVGRAATAAGMRAEKALEAPVTRTLERGGRSAEMLQALSAQPSFAVKPRGGSFMSSGDVTAPPISKLDETLRSYADAMKSEMPSRDPKQIDSFVDKKLRKYFTTSFGTGDDPVRNAVAKGDLQIYGYQAEDLDKFTPYLLASARNPNAPGHELAKRNLEKLYDRFTNIQSRAISAAPAADADQSAAIRAANQAFEARNAQLMTQEGVPQAFQNPLRTEISRADDFARYPNLYGPYIRAMESRAQGTLPPQAAYTLERSAPFYDVSMPLLQPLDPDEVARSIASIPEKKLANMSFEQALLEGSKNLRVYRDYEVAVDKARKGQNVPKDVVSMFTKPMQQTDRGQWVRITDPAGTKLEGALMHHSVGGYDNIGKYGHGGKEGFLSGRAQVFSFRDQKTGLPNVTIEAEKIGDTMSVTQIKGVFNSPPTFFGEDVFRFLDKNPQIKKVSSEYYTRDNTGKELTKNIAIDWEKSFDNWKANNGVGEWTLVNPGYGQAELYIWGAPRPKARGGMVERREDTRAYL